MYRPTCRRCGESHFNFMSCAEADERRKRHVPPPIQWRDDVPQWGDKLDTIDIVGNTYWLKKGKDG